MDRQTEPGLEYQLNRDANQTIFLLTLILSIQATPSQKTSNYSGDIHDHNPGLLVDSNSQNLSGIAEIS